MKPTDLETVRTLVLGLWPKALSAQIAVLLEKIEDYDRDQVCVIVREVSMQPHKGFLDAGGKIVERCRATKAKYVGEPAPVVKYDADDKEGHTPGELCDMAYAGTLTGAMENATPRGKAWMRAIGEKRARARAAGGEPFEPSGGELIYAATSDGKPKRSKYTDPQKVKVAVSRATRSRIELGEPSKRDTETGGGAA